MTCFYLAQAACVRHACLRAPCAAWPLLSPSFSLSSSFIFFSLRPRSVTAAWAWSIYFNYLIGFVWRSPKKNIILHMTLLKRHKKGHFGGLPQIKNYIKIYFLAPILTYNIDLILAIHIILLGVLCDFLEFFCIFVKP